MDDYGFWKARLLDIDKASDLHVPLETVTTTYSYRIIGQGQAPLCEDCVRAYAMKVALKGWLLWSAITVFVTLPSCHYVYTSIRDGEADTWVFAVVILVAILSLAAPGFAAIQGVDYLQARGRRWSGADKARSGHLLAVHLDEKAREAGLGGEDGSDYRVAYWTDEEYREKFADGA